MINIHQDCKKCKIAANDDVTYCSEVCNVIDQYVEFLSDYFNSHNYYPEDLEMDIYTIYENGRTYISLDEEV